MNHILSQDSFCNSLLSILHFLFSNFWKFSPNYPDLKSYFSNKFRETEEIDKETRLLTAEQLHHGMKK